MFFVFQISSQALFFLDDVRMVIPGFMAAGVPNHLVVMDGDKSALVLGLQYDVHAAVFARLEIVLEHDVIDRLVLPFDMRISKILYREMDILDSPVQDESVHLLASSTNRYLSAGFMLY